MQESKPESAYVHLTKIINGFETEILSKVIYNDNPEMMILDAVMQEVHNHNEDDRDLILDKLNENSFQYFDDDFDISLVVEYIEPFTEKQLDKDMILTIKYPSI